MKKTDGYIKKTEKVSIIVPVYNVEPYLREALDSVIKQTYENLEILVVDDGSTDGSGAICDEYAAIDERIRVIHQENEGLSGARNIALDIMTGDLVMFLDPDDIYHPQIVEKLVTALKRENADMVLCRYISRYILKKWKPIARYRQITPVGLSGIYDRKEALCALIDGKMNVHVWNKIYRRYLWDEIRFPDGHVYEDMLTTYKIMNRTRKLYMLDEVLYQKRIRRGAITMSFSEKNIMDRILAFSMRDRYIQDHIQGIFSKEQLLYLEKIKLRQLMDMYYRYSARMNSEKMFSAEFRKMIIEMQSTINLHQCNFRFRVMYYMLCSCPNLMKLIYPVSFQLYRCLVFVLDR